MRLFIFLKSSLMNYFMISLRSFYALRPTIFFCLENTFNRVPACGAVGAAGKREPHHVRGDGCGVGQRPSGGRPPGRHLPAPRPEARRPPTLRRRERRRRRQSKVVLAPAQRGRVHGEADRRQQQLHRLWQLRHACQLYQGIVWGGKMREIYTWKSPGFQ